MKKGVKTPSTGFVKLIVLSVCLLSVQIVSLKFDNFFLQAAAAFVLGFASARGGLRLSGAKTLGQSLNILIICNLLSIAAEELRLQLAAHAENKPFQIWRSLLTMSESMAVMVIWCAVFLCCAWAAYCRAKKPALVGAEEWKSFFRSVTCAFSVYYVFQLFYFLFLHRVAFGISYETGVNLVPFRMVGEYFFGDNAGEYNIFVNFFGNIFLFVPMGFAFRLRLARGGWLLWLLPIAVSCSIEAFQFFTHLGYTDIDDVILNVSGCYIGIWLESAIDCAVKKTEKQIIKD